MLVDNDQRQQLQQKQTHKKRQLMNNLSYITRLRMALRISNLFNDPTQRGAFEKQAETGLKTPELLQTVLVSLTDSLLKRESFGECVWLCRAKGLERQTSYICTQAAHSNAAAAYHAEYHIQYHTQIHTSR